MVKNFVDVVVRMNIKLVDDLMTDDLLLLIMYLYDYYYNHLMRQIMKMVV
jgi:hypothetical protein